MAAWSEQLAGIQKKRIVRNDLERQILEDRTAIEKIDRQLLDIRQKLVGANPQLERELEQKKTSLEQQYRRRAEEFKSHIADLNETIAGIYVNPHPKSVIGHLDDSIPFLLFPVRIETRFITDARQPELWLRIYPDEIVIHTHERSLTPSEVAHGEKYWKNIFEIEKNGAPTIDEEKKGAWSVLVSKYGAGRSAWVGRQTKPTNWSFRQNLSGADLLTFPQHDTSTANWTRAPRTNVLPDKFVVMLYRGQNVREETGNNIPDVLKVGPDPMDAENSFVTENNKLLFGEEFNWTSDFDKAISVGMGLKIPLNTEEAENGFDKIIVLGLMLSMDEEETRKEVEELISNHHYSPNGFGIVKQGTATNNTEQDGSGYTTSDPFHEAGFEESGVPLFDQNEEKDAKFLADAIGIAYEPLQFIDNGDAQDRLQAIAMNTALYPSTLGYYFDTLLAPAVSEVNQKSLRDFFTRYVSGRGPLPAIRVGSQPYGVLVTSDFSNWTWSRTEHSFDLSFLNGMHKLLQYYHDIWQGLLDQLVYVGKPGIDPEQALMNILGLQAGSVSFFQRNAFSTDDLRNRDEFEHGGRYYAEMQAGFTSKNTLLEFITTNGGSVTDDNGNLKVPQLLRLIFQHYHTRLDANNLVDGVPLSEKNIVRDYNETDGKNYLEWLVEIEKVEELELQNFGEGVQPPSALLYMQLRRALLLQLHKSSVKWLKTKGHDVDLTSGAVNFYNIRPQATPTKWELMKAKVALVVPDHLNQQLSIADYLLQGNVDEEEAAFLKQQKTALQELAKMSTAALERCFTEHIDTCSYRLDAWQTAMFTYRLENIRKSREGRQGRRTGIYCGCYGLVENLRPERRRRLVDGREIHRRSERNETSPLYEYADNGGFVLAPSINHAVAASVIRAGYLSHADSSNPDILSINLSSERVRRALFILEGIRNGQRLEVLLGYQFERGLHDRASANPNLARLNEHIYAYRDVYKIPVHYIKQQGTNDTEAIAANNVVNGLLLAETKLAYPYGAVIPPPADAAHDPRAAIEAEKNRLEDSLDAIKDLLLSESIYQLSLGNIDRAGAVLNAMQEGNVPPELEVIRTPRSSHFTFTNRVTLHFEDAQIADNPWSSVPMTERAIMEPGLNLWLGGMFGNISSLSCIVSEKSGETEINPMTIGINKLNLQPIDIIYLTAETIQERLAREYRKLSGLADNVIVSIDYHTMKTLLPLIELLRSVLNGGRALTAVDFISSSSASQSTPYTDSAELETRLSAAKDRFDARLDSINSLPLKISGTPKTLEQVFEDLEENGGDFADVDFEFTASAQLMEILTVVAEFGVSDAYPVLTSAIDKSSKVALLNQAMRVARRMKEASDAATAIMSAATMPDADKTAAFTEAAKLIFGSAFTIFPKFKYVNATDISLSNNDRDQLLQHATTQLGMPLPADEWMQTMSHVRPRLHDWEQVRTYVELHNTENIKALPVQVPYRSKDSWVAVEFPAEYSAGKPFTIEQDTLSVLANGEHAFDVTKFQSGLLIDEFTESVPAKEEIAGLAFNYDQPSAMAPQALLLAVSPQLDGQWKWEDLLGIVNDTFLRAKLRAVEPALLDKLNNPQTGVLLPALLASFSKYDLDFALDYRLNLEIFQQQAPILNAMTAINE